MGCTNNAFPFLLGMQKSSVQNRGRQLGEGGGGGHQLGRGGGGGGEGTSARGDIS